MAYRVRILGTVDRPRVEVSGEVVQDATWDQISQKFGRDENWMRDRLQNNWADRRGRPVVRPAAIFTSDHGPQGWHWGDQSYSRYGLQPVRLIQRAVRSRILKETSEPYAAVVDEWINHSDTETEYGGQLDYSLSDTIESNWSANASIGIQTQVGIEVGSEALGVKASASQTLSLETSFGVGGSKSRQETVSLSRSISKTVQPHTGASPRITATKGSLVVLVDYRALARGPPMDRLRTAAGGRQPRGAQLLLRTRAGPYRHASNHYRDHSDQLLPRCPHGDVRHSRSLRTSGAGYALTRAIKDNGAPCPPSTAIFCTWWP